MPLQESLIRRLASEVSGDLIDLKTSSEYSNSYELAIEDGLSFLVGDLPDHALWTFVTFLEDTGTGVALPDKDYVFPIGAIYRFSDDEKSFALKGSIDEDHLYTDPQRRYWFYNQQHGTVHCRPCGGTIAFFAVDKEELGYDTTLTNAPKNVTYAFLRVLVCKAAEFYLENQITKLFQGLLYEPDEFPTRPTVPDLSAIAIPVRPAFTAFPTVDLSTFPSDFTRPRKGTPLTELTWPSIPDLFSAVAANIPETPTISALEGSITAGTFDDTLEAGTPPTLDIFSNDGDPNTEPLFTIPTPPDWSSDTRPSITAIGELPANITLDLTGSEFQFPTAPTTAQIGSVPDAPIFSGEDSVLENELPSDSEIGTIDIDFSGNLEDEITWNLTLDEASGLDDPANAPSAGTATAYANPAALGNTDEPSDTIGLDDLLDSLADLGSTIYADTVTKLQADGLPDTIDTDLTKGTETLAAFMNNDDIEQFDAELRRIQETIRVANIELQQKGTDTERYSLYTARLNSVIAKGRADVEAARTKLEAGLEQWRSTRENVFGRQNLLIQQAVQKFEADYQKWRAEFDTQLAAYQAKVNADLERNRQKIQSRSEVDRLKVQDLAEQSSQRAQYNQAIIQKGTAEVNAASVEVNAKVRKFEAELSAWTNEMQTRANVYSSQVEAWSTRSRTLVENYSTGVRAVSERIRAELEEYTQRIEAWFRPKQLRLEGERAEIEAWATRRQSEVSVYSTQVQAFATQVNAAVNEFTAKISAFNTTEQVKIADFQARLRAYEVQENLKIEKGRLDFEKSAEKQRQELQLFGNEIQNYATRSNEIFSRFQAEVQSVSQEMTFALEEFNVNLQRWISEWQTTINDHQSEVQDLIAKWQIDLTRWQETIRIQTTEYEMHSSDYTRNTQEVLENRAEDYRIRDFKVKQLYFSLQRKRGQYRQIKTAFMVQAKRFAPPIARHPSPTYA